MPDLNLTISNLETQIRWIEDIECHQFPGWMNATMAMRDAVALLKGKEPVKPSWRQGKASCGACGYQIPQRTAAKFCPTCGRKIRWNGEDRI